MSQAVILGTGLIGASIGQGLRAAGWQVAAWDPDPAVLERAVAVGAVDLELGHGEVVPGADVVVLAGPPSAVVDAVGELETDSLVHNLESLAALTDVLSQAPKRQAEGLSEWIRASEKSDRE